MMNLKMIKEAVGMVGFKKAMVHWWQWVLCTSSPKMIMENIIVGSVVVAVYILLLVLFPIAVIACTLILGSVALVYGLVVTGYDKLYSSIHRQCEEAKSEAQRVHEYQTTGLGPPAEVLDAIQESQRFEQATSTMWRE